MPSTPTTPSPPPLLRIEGLETHLGQGNPPLRVVDDLHLAISRGETFALLGESGCGKSMRALSLMRLLPEGAGIAAGADGLIIEVHPHPEEAWSDGAQSLKPEKFAQMVRDVKRVAEAVGRC